MTATGKRHRNSLLERLKDPTYAADYLNAALEEEDQATFLNALRNVADAGHFPFVAGVAQVARESLYRILSDTGNPTLKTLNGILGAVNLTIEVKPKARAAGATACSRTTVAPERAVYSLTSTSATGQNACLYSGSAATSMPDAWMINEFEGESPCMET